MADYEGDTLEVCEDNGNLFLKIPIDWIIFEQENRRDPYLITKKQKMIEWLTNNIFYVGEDEDDGIGQFQKFWNQLFDYAYGNGESFLEGMSLK